MRSETLARALSEDNKRFRQKNMSVNIKIAFVTWILEFSVGMGVLIFWFFVGNNEYMNFLRLFNWTIYLIILPFMYILNRQVTKTIIIMENWVAGIRSIFMAREQQNQEVERLERLYLRNQLN